MDKAVILARGLGTRMRKTAEGAELSEDQAALADIGLKAMIPIDRPFLDYVLHQLAQSGYRQICLVIGPEHGAVRDYYTNSCKCSRLSIDYAIQEKPLGTGDAVSAAEAFAGGDPFLVINSDNYYPLEALEGLRHLEGPGLAGFEQESMLAGSNIPKERLTKFAAIKTDSDGYMAEILEKPDAETLASLPRPICISMNCWRFGPEIFEACKNITPSQRGELELPDAVQYSIDHLGQRYKSLTIEAPVLDLSSRNDIAMVVEKLAGTEINI